MATQRRIHATAWLRSQGGWCGVQLGPRGDVGPQAGAQEAAAGLTESFRRGMMSLDSGGGVGVPGRARPGPRSEVEDRYVQQGGGMLGQALASSGVK